MVSQVRLVWCNREVSLDRKMETDSRRANNVMIRKSLDVFLMVRRRLTTAYDINSSYLSSWGGDQSLTVEMNYSKPYYNV